MVSFLVGTLTIIIVLLYLNNLKAALNPKHTFENYKTNVKQIEEQLGPDTRKYLVKIMFLISLMYFVFFLATTYFVVGFALYIAYYCAFMTVVSFLVSKHRVESDSVKPTSLFGIVNHIIGLCFSVYFAYYFFIVL